MIKKMRKKTRSKRNKRVRKIINRMQSQPSCSVTQVSTNVFSSSSPKKSQSISSSYAQSQKNLKKVKISRRYTGTSLPSNSYS